MKGFWVRAVYDFISSKTQDLSFRDGDILTITDVVSRNWWHAKNVVGEMGFIPSNFVQVLPQYGEATIECDSFIEEIEVQEHESSASSLQITFKSKDMGGEGQEPSTVSHNIVKTVPNLSQFVRELSRTFPEAGLPLEVQEGTEWAQLLGSLHEFNSTKTPVSANAFLQNLITFTSMNGMLYAWLRPGTQHARPRVTSRRITEVERQKMGREAIMLHDWEGDRANGELADLKIGDHVIIVHEQNDWAYCRSSPESTENGYVPLMYLRKIAKAGEWRTSAPPVPPHIKLNKAGKPPPDEELLNETPSTYLATNETSSTSVNAAVKSFTLKTTDGFDELIENGLTVEVMKEGGEVAGQVGVGCSVTLTCTALKWEPSRGVARSFSSTDVDPNYDRLTFVVGKGQVTQALEEGVQRLVVGDEAVIVGAPSMCYGDIGLPGYVSGKSYVVYEVELLSSVEGASGTECFGPEGLVKKDAKAKVAKSGLGVAIDSSVTSLMTREKMPAPKGAREGGSEGKDGDGEEKEGMEAGEAGEWDEYDGKEGGRSSRDRGTSLSQVRDSLSTNDLIKEVQATGLVIGFDEGGVTAQTKTATLTKPVTPPQPPPPKIIRKGGSGSVGVGRSSNRKGTTQPVDMVQDSTPPPLSIPMTLADNTPPAPSLFIKREKMPISPSDSIMSPVSKLYTKSGGGGMKMMMMNKKSLPSKMITIPKPRGEGERRDKEEEGGEKGGGDSDRLSPFMPSL